MPYFEGFLAKIQRRRLAAFKLDFRQKAPKYGMLARVLHKLPTAGAICLAKGPTLCGGKSLGFGQFMQNLTTILDQGHPLTRFTPARWCLRLALQKT